MELYTECQNCKEDILVKPIEITRSELEYKLGAVFKYQCQDCLSSKNYHVNDVKARISKKQLIVAVILGILLSAIMTLFLWENGWVSTFTFVVPIIIVSYLYKDQQTRASAFNGYLLDRD